MLTHKHSLADRIAAHIRGRFARRDERGYVMLLTLAAVLLLMGFSLVLLGAAKDQLNAARTGQSFALGRQGVSDAEATALREINKVGSTFRPDQSTVVSSTPRPGGVGTFQFYYDAATLTLRSRGAAAVNENEQDSSLPLRWLYVGSKDVDASTGNIIYGVAANGTSTNAPNAGIWSYGLAAASSRSSGNSVVRGVFATQVGQVLRPDFDFAALGGTTSLDALSTANGLRVTTFSDNAKVSGNNWSNAPYRSNVTLQYDLNLLRLRALDDPSNSFWNCLGNPPPNSVLTTGALYCARGSYVLPANVSAPSSGVATVVIRGDLTIPADITPGALGQIHFYVTGSVIFAKPSGGSSQKAGNVFVYAPSGECSATGAALELTGAMACRSLNLPSNANRFTHVFPVADNASLPGAATDRIFYTEAPGYIDSRTP